jgi:circadian clock protein KaiB
MKDPAASISLNPEYRFRLFIAGMNPASIRAIEIVRGICDRYLNSRYDLEVIDVYQQRHLASEMNLIAVPTLIRLFPSPEKRIIGDMRDVKQVMEVMEINEEGQLNISG